MILRVTLNVALGLIAAFVFGSMLSAQQPAECFVFSRLGESTPFVSDATECARKTAPASTFKIPHALIALQTGVITADTVVKWDGTAYDFEGWRRDHTLASAIEWSVLPFFRRTAHLIGPERMRKQLSALGYSTDTFDGDVAAFWVTGDLVVSPSEQVAFLQRMFSGTLPIPARHVSTVKDAFRMRPGQVVSASGAHPFALSWPSETIVYAKTGNTSVAGERVSWLVGALQSSGSGYVFAARVRSSAAVERTAGIALAARELNAHKPQ